jgi:hypothetical protein
MSDPRLNSVHLGFLPRRQDYRRAREALLGERGWLTMAAERVHAWVGTEENWPSLLPFRPEQILLATKYCLVDYQADCCYLLQAGLNTIGRLPDNDIVLEDITISRRHCSVILHACGGCDMYDMASLNGTFVNGARVVPSVRLVSCDRIRVGSRQLVFVSERDYAAVLEHDDHPETAVG